MSGSAFIAGLEQGVIRLLACTVCGTRQTLDPLVCRRCGATALEWQAVEGRGTVYAITVVHRAPSAAFGVAAPYALVLVDLEGGGRLMGHGAPGLTIGASVDATIFHGAGLPLVRFLPAETAP